MSEQLSAPRITASYLENFQGRHVTIVGKVTQLRGEQATIDADGVVTLHLNRVCLPLHFYCFFSWHFVLHRVLGSPHNLTHFAKPRRANNMVQDAHLTNGNAVQVIGKVSPDLSVKVLTSKDLGPNVGRCNSMTMSMAVHFLLFSFSSPNV